MTNLKLTETGGNFSTIFPLFVFSNKGTQAQRGYVWGRTGWEGGVERDKAIIILEDEGNGIVDSYTSFANPSIQLLNNLLSTCHVP